MAKPICFIPGLRSGKFLPVTRAKNHYKGSNWVICKVSKGLFFLHVDFILYMCFGCALWQYLKMLHCIVAYSSHLSIECCNVLNPTILLPLPQDGTPHHSCEELVAIAHKPRSDLSDVSLENPDLILLTGRSSKVVNGQRHTVVSPSEVLEAARLSNSFSARAAKRVALTRACHTAKDQSVSLYMDSNMHLAFAMQLIRYGNSEFVLLQLDQGSIMLNR